MNRLRTLVSRPAITAVLALIMSAGIADAQTKIKTGFNLFSPEQDVQIGQQSAAAAEQQLPVLRDASVEAYVSRIGAKLAANAGGPQFPYRFRVVNASDINAFALPGGPIYINRGILENARNEGEVAGVIAHEIAHVALRHGTHQASKAHLAQAGIGILGGILGGKVGQGTADIINTVGGIGLNALFLKYSRDLETQADVRGAQILAASGYAPADMVGFFNTLARVDTARKTTWLSHHPAPPDRIARIQKEAQVLRVADSPTVNVAELNSVQSRLRGYGSAPTMQQIAQGTAPQQTPSQSARRRSTQPGTASSTITVEPPSSSLRTFTARSGVFRVAHPSNWQVYEQGNNGVTIAPPGAVVGNGIVYGAIINHYEPFGNSRSLISGPTTLEDATNDLLAMLQQSSPYLRVASGSGQRVRMANGNALAATLRGTDPNTGVAERVTVVTRKLHDDHLIYMLFITPERDAKNYSSVLNAMVNSMQISDHAH
jgi:beta-barrel assembly-enhancing protease